MNAATLVLSAGASSRMGRPKALLELGGATFLERIDRCARDGGVGQVWLVLGPPDGERIRERAPRGCRVAWNPDPARGMLSSVQAGVAALDPAIEAALIWPVDQPLVTAATVRALLEAPPERIAAPQHAGRGGHPVRIPRRLFRELLALPPELGLRALLHAHPDEITRIPVDDTGAVTDVDTPDDYAQVTSTTGPARR